VRFRIALLLILTLLGGCNRTKKRTIAVIPKGTAHLFWLTVRAGAEAGAKEYGLEMEWNGPPAETDYSRQIQILDSYIARQVDAIALAATEKTALNNSLERAKAANIPVTIFDSGVDSDNFMTFIATNNFEAGQMGARTLAKLINNKGKVAILLNAPGSVSTMDRERGFQETIEKEFPNIKIVASQYGMSDRAKAMAASENMLTANPDLDGLFASAEPSSVGAAQAVKARNQAGKVKLVTFDSSDGLIEALKDNTIQAMVVQDPYKMGHDAVKTLADKLNGQAPPKRIDLSARVVTRADLDKPEVQQLLNPVKK